MLMAANQVGKTWCAACETTAHLTGRYPEWWPGKRFDRPVRWIAGSESSELTTKGVQRLLIGPPENESAWGTGAIPKECLLDWDRRSGVPNGLAGVVIRHVSGEVSSCQFQSYDQGRTKWQADTLDGAWLDEEPPEDIYFEVLTRTNTTLGPVYITLTPLLGATQVVRRFFVDKAVGTHLTMMTIFDAEHFTDEQRQIIIASYPEHERKARTEGIPQLGSGRVFPISKGEILCEPFNIPKHWPQICGIDFGWDHPSAGIKLAWDRDSDCIYLIAEHRAREQTPMMFSAATKGWGEIPWAWPHDGKQSGGKFDRADQQQLQAIYKTHGLQMLFEHAQFEDGTNGVEAGITQMLERMQTGRWKVFPHLTGWLEEFELYHRKEGLIVKLNDDLISASRYAYMMRRYAGLPKKAEIDQGEVYLPQAARQDALGWMG